MSAVYLPAEVRELLKRVLIDLESGMMCCPSDDDLCQLRALLSQPQPQPAEVCDTCHGKGEVWTGESQSFDYMSMQPPEPIMEACPECGGESAEVEQPEDYGWLINLKLAKVECNCQWNPDSHADSCPVYLSDRLADAQRGLAQHHRITAQLRAECERLRHSASQELAERLAAQLIESGAENYQEAHFDLEFEASGIKCVAVVRLQHPDKPSPHELRMQAEAERDQLRARVGELEAEIEEWSGTAVQNGMEADRLRELLRDTWDAVGEFAWDSELEARIYAALNPAPANKENEA